MYKLKNVAKRGSALLGAVGLLTGIGTSALPAFASADSLNPLTKRSLTLSSSSPGWSFKDGSGNTLYAPPNSGANGQKTGNTFSFNVSTDSSVDADTDGNPDTPIKTMSFQYCTKSAGECYGPGDNAPLTDLNDPTGASGTSDLDVVFPSPDELNTGANDFDKVVDTSKGVIKAVPGYAGGAASAVAGNFVVFYRTSDNGTPNNDTDDTWVQSTGWSLSVANVETVGADDTAKNNYIVLTNSTGLGIPSDTTVRVVFFGTTNDYITNPGSGKYFVKINTYKNTYDGSTAGHNLASLEPTTDTNVIDGGVTVANVMNQSIQITTKVLETMQFSVGTFDPNVTDSSNGGADGSGTQSDYEAAEGITNPNDNTTPHAKHQTCDAILMSPLATDAQKNVLALGDQTSESSLAVEHTYSTHSYWRLSSNSSAGATVYYSGHTLSNTENDLINPVNNGDGTAAVPQPGGEQFGLALDNDPASTATINGVSGVHDWAVSYAQEATYENGVDNGKTAINSSVTTDVGANASWHTPRLYPLIPLADYDGGKGTINGSPDTSFAFDSNSDTIPAAIATENNQVVDCVTGKMRYIANIAATTPAGIYTTKINYIAAPQY